jgi:hypothetical protein
MTTANGRNTRFELLSLRQDANGYFVNVTERGTRAGAFDLPELLKNDMFTDEEHALLIRAFTIIEERVAQKYDELLVSPEEAQLRMLAAAKAKEDAAKAAADREASERAAQDADQKTVVRKQELLSLEERHKATRDALAKSRADLEQVRAETTGAIAAREQLHAELAAKRAEMAAAATTKTEDTVAHAEAERK